ncbi:MAG: hypothetical protein JRH11_05140 [Deltaproteobacteria bacterium]|nr:hypothetical protein [Deltaproteobacteria bacterium]
MRPTTLALIAATTSSLLLVAGSAAAQRVVAYDTASVGTPAAVTCGFCGGEKFGVVFRELGAGVGLQADEFPLTINSLQIAVASATVTGDGLSTPVLCRGSAEEGTVGVTVEIYAGPTAPTGSILDNPQVGPWAGETEIFAQSIDLTRSFEMPSGSAMYNVELNDVTVDGGAMVDASNTYVRVVATVPSGGSSTTCTTLGLPSPGAVGIRDNDGRIGNNVGFIYALNPLDGLLGIAEGWHWNESPEITDIMGGAAGIDGDWLIRMNIAPASGPTPDAGVPTDSGTAPDAGDGSTPVDDGGMPIGCMADGECAGGEICSEGVCMRVSCAAASDCGGGMTCVDGRCRGLCSVNADCAGGEVCNTADGICVAVGASDDGGCSCGVHQPGSTPIQAFAFLALGALLYRRRRR